MVDKENEFKDFFLGNFRERFSSFISFFKFFTKHLTKSSDFVETAWENNFYNVEGQEVFAAPSIVLLSISFVLLIWFGFLCLGWPTSLLRIAGDLFGIFLFFLGIKVYIIRNDIIDYFKGPKNSD